MATPKPARKPRRTTTDQQGAKGRLVAETSGPPILSPRTSKVPAQDSDFLTAANGQRLPQTDDSLKAGHRGPTLMEDFHLREKITHFDHERIPERVVHARGTAAHGVFQSYGTAAEITSAAFLQPGAVTPVFTRFSTVLGSRGSADTVRDVRGFAVKFYTDEGVFDLVGNNIPVFFIRDGIKFPDLIHAGKPEPDREIPQAQTAHTTFWDFVSMLPESPHMLMWVMSDRAIPRSYRMMEGFGVHTFRLVNNAGETNLVKFHWKPVLGVHGLVWDEALTFNGVEPDFHRRDLYNAIGAGAFPEWELGVQVMPDTEDQYFNGIDLLDSTKIVPEELAPVQPIGRMTLNRCPANFFAEVEQVAYHVGHLVRGIEIVDDPLMHARMFSYLDTQLTRLAGPNFTQIPINRSHSPVNDNFRDGFHQHAVHQGRTPYLPNAVGGGCPFLAGAEDGGYIHVPRMVDGPKVRDRGPDDEYAQATLFWNSMTEIEQDHIVDAYTFELGHVEVPAVVERMVNRLALVDADLSRRVCVGLGLPAPVGKPMSPADASIDDDPSRDNSAEHDAAAGLDASPALSMNTENVYPVDGRVVQILANDGCDLAGIRVLQEALLAVGVVPHVVATHKGAIAGARRGDELTVDRSFHTASSAEADALIVAHGAGLANDPAVNTYVQSAYRHFKPIAAWGDGGQLLGIAGVDPNGAGVVTSEKANKAFARLVIASLAAHRHWDRAATHPTRLTEQAQ
ncbi:MAG: catalase [Ilumatobacteraceae bacterium]|nr:catalase [Ilumatobacteraceae bacterium]